MAKPKLTPRANAPKNEEPKAEEAAAKPVVKRQEVPKATTDEGVGGVFQIDRDGVRRRVS